jgi:hypothetical protein
MRMIRVAAAGLFALAVPATAQAQWYVSPSIAGQFGGASRTIGVTAESTPSPWSVAVAGGRQQGWVAAEGEFAYAPRFFDDRSGFVTRRSLTTLMGNVRVFLPYAAVQPFAVAGAGLIRPVVAEPGGLAEVDEALFGWNAGGGVRTPLTSRLGLHVDVRYFRARAGGEANVFAIELDGLDFWRTSAGVTLRW